MYDRALSSIQSVAWNLSNQDTSTSSVQKRLATLVTSCIDLSESSLGSLKWFMARHYLPWPEASRKDLLDIFLDLSGNYNFHLWFQISVDLSRDRSKTGDPLLKMGPSPSFRVWIALMRTFGSQLRGTTLSLQYHKYVRSMLRLFDVPESRTDELIATIEEMNRLALAMLGPAMANPEQRTLRMPIQNFTDSVTPGISASRWVLLLNKYFMWAGRFSAETMVQVENPDLFRALVYLLRLNTEVREAMTLSLGLRVVTELGWMADRRISAATLELMGLPSSAHTRRCLVQVESSVGIAWLSLFPRNRGAAALVEDVRDALIDVVMRHTRTSFDLRARSDDAQLDDESFFANALPDSTFGPSFFDSWMNLTNSRWQLQKPNLINILKPGSAISQRWSLYSALTASDEYFLFPLFHPDLPLAVNYGGAGRLLADEVLRGLFYELLASDQQRQSRDYYIAHSNESAPTQPQPEWSPHSVDTEALLAALKAYRLGILRQSNSTDEKNSTIDEHRLFFVASCYALCSSDDYVGELYGDASRRCNMPVAALPEFRAAFQCDGHNESQLA
ncbi:hypothetical protein V5799_008649 [Amblyomma americanum]|uniref:Peptidase M13 N-terminal domain-containing protein n=1 Tax=Amblyomma americanum TaxID=6943 RepID=A0AAQ4FCU7_AMBAM